jgi:glutamate synthase domain-containing protein 3
MSEYLNFDASVNDRESVIKENQTSHKEKNSQDAKIIEEKEIEKENDREEEEEEKKKEKESVTVLCHSLNQIISIRKN